MDREYDPGNANLKKHCILPALLLVIIRFCPIYLLWYWLLFWVYLSTANWICLSHFFFRPQRLKYPVYTVAGVLFAQKKCGKRKKERWTLHPSSSFNLVAFSWIFLRLILPPKKTASKAALCSRIVARCYFVFVGQVRYCLVIG